MPVRTASTKTLAVSAQHQSDRFYQQFINQMQIASYNDYCKSLLIAYGHPCDIAIPYNRTHLYYPAIVYKRTQLNDTSSWTTHNDLLSMKIIGLDITKAFDKISS